jgi:uncharacterized membrane protein YoaK (UPF0700 family)
MPRHSFRARRAYLSLDDAGQDALLDATAWRWKPVTTTLILLEIAPPMLPLAAVFGYHYLVAPLAFGWLVLSVTAALLALRFWPDAWEPDLQPTRLAFMTSIQLSAIEKDLARKADPRRDN